MGMGRSFLVNWAKSKFCLFSLIYGLKWFIFSSVKFENFLYNELAFILKNKEVPKKVYL